MKVRRKVLATLLAAVTMLSMGVTAFAEPGASGSESITPPAVTLYKEYTAPNGGTSPAEDFTFSADLISVTDAAAGISADDEDLQITSIDCKSYEEGNAGNDSAKKKEITVTLPTYTSVGVYTYKIDENAGNTAGVEYDSTSVYLKVTIYRENGELTSKVVVRRESETGDKLNDGDAAFINKYFAGTLNVKKVVAGNMGDQSKEFDFTVTFTKPADNKEVNSTVTATVAGNAADDFVIDWKDGNTFTYNFKLSHDETATFSNLPSGVKYEVTEVGMGTEETEGSNGYKTKVEGMNVKTIDNATTTENVTFTNTKTGEVDTGITLDTLPYILVFGLVMIAAVVMIVRRRRVED